jgi:hypothetical protein
VKDKKQNMQTDIISPCGSVPVLKRKISILKEYCRSIGCDCKDIEYSILVSCKRDRGRS